MVYIKLLDGERVASIYYMPFDPSYGLGKTREELEAEGGVFVDAIPEPENRPGKSAVLKYSEADGLYYEYVDRPKTPEEELEDLKRQQALMQTAIDDLIFGGML